MRDITEGQTPMQCSFMESCIWMCQCWLTSKDLHTSALCGHWMQSRRPTRSDEWLGWMAGESRNSVLCEWLNGDLNNSIIFIYQILYNMIICTSPDESINVSCCCSNRISRCSWVRSDCMIDKYIKKEYCILYISRFCLFVWSLASP